MVAAATPELPESAHHPTSRPSGFRTPVVAAVVPTEPAALTELAAKPELGPCLEDLPSDRQASVEQLAAVVELLPDLRQAPASS